MTTARSLLFMFIIGALGAPVTAETELKVEVGWGGALVSDKWAPILVTLRDSSVRNVSIELYVPHDPLHAMRIRQIVPVGPTPATFPLYAPLSNNIHDISLTIRDAKTDKRLAEWRGDDVSGNTNSSFSTAGQLIAISGASGTSQFIESNLTDNSSTVCRAVDPLRLPEVAQGYDALSVLLLNQPDLARLTRPQQEAIIDWVRSGGHLICWFSENALPQSSPIIDGLPAVVEENTAIQLSEAAVRDAGLPPRFRNLKARQLIPLPLSEKIPLFGGEAAAWRRQFGFGTIVLLPIDPSTFLFSSTSHSRRFWAPLLEGAIELSNPRERNNSLPDVLAQMTQRRAAAVNVAMDIVGNVPGAGAFGFSYVAIVMVGMMIIVGPVDWFVLKKLGRQPWTWVTTGGWIALVTLGAIYIGHFINSGEVHFNTLRLIDQADNTIAAHIDAVGIYSPRTQEYPLEVAAESWWEPLSATVYYSSGNAQTDLDFHQDYRGNRPENTLVNIWNLRMLAAQTVVPSPGIIEANLHGEMRAGRKYVVGTIANRGTAPLSKIVIRLKGGICNLNDQTLTAGATLNVDQSVMDGESQYQYNPEHAYQYNSRPESIWDLSPTRAGRIDQILNTRGDAAVIYAQADNTPAIANLKVPAQHQHHQQYVRALIQLHGSGS